MIKVRISRDTKKNFELEKVRSLLQTNKGFYSNNYVEYADNGDRNKALFIEDYLDKIRPYLKDIVNNIKISDTWKIQLTLASNLMSSKDTGEERLTHSKSGKVEIIINGNADEVIEEISKLLFSIYQIGSETAKEGSSFIFDYVDLWN